MTHKKPTSSFSKKLKFFVIEFFLAADFAFFAFWFVENNYLIIL